MSINIFNEAGCCRVCIEDELTIYTAGFVASAINEALAANEKVDLDLTAVTEIDTAGLQVLLVARKEALLRERTLGFIGHNRVVMDCLHLMNLANFFRFDTAPARLAEAA